MAVLQDERRRAIANIIRTGTPRSQDELGEHLARLGFAVTQATISRDLEQIGAVKVRRGGHISYALPDQIREAPSPRLAAVFRDWVRSIDTAANLVVIKTPPGSAHLVGVALDGAELPQLVGTICGDDTIFAACRSVADAEALAQSLPFGKVQ